MRLPRWAHRLYAWTFGYFWKPCPICGKYFGGHEIENMRHVSVPVGLQMHYVCPSLECVNKALSNNLRDWYKVPYWRNK